MVADLPLLTEIINRKHESRRQAEAAAAKVQTPKHHIDYCSKVRMSSATFKTYQGWVEKIHADNVKNGLTVIDGVDKDGKEKLRPMTKDDEPAQATQFAGLEVIEDKSLTGDGTFVVE